MTRIAIAVVGFFIGVFLVLTALSRFASSLPLPGHQPPFFLGATSAAVVDTWNPSDKSAQATLSGGNLTWSNGDANNQGVRSIVGKTSGLLYHEYKILNTGGGRNDCGNGIAASSFVFSSSNTLNILWMFNSGAIFFNNASTGKTLGSRSNNDIISVAVDFPHLKAWMRANAGNWNGDASANPATNTNGIDVSAVFTSQAAFVLGTNNATVNATVGTLNVGATSFAQTVPSGFSAWN